LALILLLLIGVGAFLLRVLAQWDSVFVQGHVLFKGVDPWYHMRLVDHMLTHGSPLFWDMRTLYPDGAAVGFQPLLSGMIAAIAWIAGLGHPTPHLVDTMGALLPPILGAITVIPVYFIGKELGGRPVGLLAALLVAVLPTEFLHRSALGFTDHHVLETLFSTCTILFILLSERHHRLWYAALAGAFLGLYLLNWHGALFFVLILWGWFGVQFYYNHTRKLDNLYLCKSALVMFGIGFLMFAPYIPHSLRPNMQVLSMTVSLGLPVVLYALVRGLNHRRILLISIASVLFVALIYTAMRTPWLYSGFVSSLKAVFWGFGTTISEAAPINLDIAVRVYGLTIALSVIGWVVLLRRRANWLVIIWSLVMFIAMIGQRRWGYYWAVNTSLLSAYLVFEMAKAVKPKAQSVLVAILCMFILLPLVSGINGSIHAANQITPQWYNSCQWMRVNTPDPFPDGDSEKPEYGVLAWWDYGHWITRIAERVPLSNPAHQTTAEVWNFLVAQSDEEAASAIDGLNVRYVIIDDLLIGPKWHAPVKLAGLNDPVGLWRNSQAVRLWNNEAKGYRLIHEEPGIKIFERV